MFGLSWSVGNYVLIAGDWCWVYAVLCCMMIELCCWLWIMVMRVFGYVVIVGCVGSLGVVSFG